MRVPRADEVVRAAGTLTEATPARIPAALAEAALAALGIHPERDSDTAALAVDVHFHVGDFAVHRLKIATCPDAVVLAPVDDDLARGREDPLRAHAYLRREIADDLLITDHELQ